MTHRTPDRDQSAENDAPAVCSCGNRFDGDNFCMPSACQWEGLEKNGPLRGRSSRTYRHRAQSSYRREEGRG